MLDHAQPRAGPLVVPARETGVRLLRVAGGMLAVAIAYYAAGRASLALQYEGPVAAVWLSTGVGASALYLAGLRYWPAVLVADVALADPAQPLAGALAITAGNLADVLAIALLLRLLVGPGATMDRLRDVGGVLAAIAAGAAISATAASLSLRAGGTIATSDLPLFWRTWFMADASGSLVVVPLVLTWAAPRTPAWHERTAWEASLVIAAVVTLSAIALSGDEELTYLAFPALIWGALRLGTRGATLAVAVAATMTVAMTAAELGPFVAQSLVTGAVGTQLYIAVATVTTLCLAAIVCERERGARELAESRTRITLAAAEERRRVEGELHDSAQNRLVALGIRLRLAEERARETAPEVAAAFPPLVDETDAVIDELRRIAHGGSPAMLESHGLVASLEAEVHHSAIPVYVDAAALGRSGPDTELAVYLCCLEAIQNAAKHAGDGCAALIRLHREDGDLAFRIRDTGRGFDPGRTRPGAGLTNLRARIEAIGGRLQITAAPGRGTTVSGVVPWRARG